MKQLFKYGIWLLMIHFGLTGSIVAQSKYGGTIFNVAKDPGNEALGSAVVAENTGVYALLWNPAALANTRNISFGFIHSKIFISDISYNFLGTSFKYRNHHLGFSMIRLGIDDIKTIDVGDTYQDIEYKNVADYILMAGIAPDRQGSPLQYGLTLKFIYSGYEVETGSGFGLDAGVLYRVWDNLSLGARLSNVFGSMKVWSTGKKEWIRPELSYGIKYEKTFREMITAAAYLNAFHYFDNRRESAASSIGFVSNELAVGFKAMYKKLVGFKTGRNALGNLTYGAEIHIPKIEINYARVHHPDLGNIQNVGVVVVLPY